MMCRRERFCQALFARNLYISTRFQHNSGKLHPNWLLSDTKGKRGYIDKGGNQALAKRYLHEIDLMRAFVILGVLAVHTTSFFNALNQDMTTGYLTLGALITSMHYTRETFFFVTGLVLFITYYRRPFRTLVFWRKRFLLIVIPYIFWTIAYICFQGALNQGTEWTFAVFWPIIQHALLTGSEYFLYFLVVSIQLYFVFPVLLYGLRKFEKYHVWILIGSFLFQLAMMWFNKFVLDYYNPVGLPRVLVDLDKYRDRFVLTYQFWFVAGGILACHYDKVAEFVRKHGKAILVTLTIGVFIVWAHYFYDRLVLGEYEGMAELVLQPIMIPYSLLVTVVYWYAGLSWSRRMAWPNWKPFTSFVKLAASTSFGIFLLQPFPLYWMEYSVNHIDRLGIPTWLHYCLWPLSILFVYFTSMFFSYWIGKIPYLSYVVGQKTHFFRKPDAASQPG